MIDSIPLGAAAALLLFALITDVKAMRIPNLLTGSFFTAGLGFHLLTNGWNGGLNALAGALAGFVPLLVLYLFKGIGAGDVKLFAALGAWIGTAPVLQVLVYTIFYAGGAGAAMVILKRSFGRRMVMGTLLLLLPQQGRLKAAWGAWTTGGIRFPFMIAVTPGALTAWLLMN
ncbi:A24 family peptidase [Paenibacillus humicola]|uniref:A24 family peptidase n=1 Tax=Paenibacillus humicola TaxID=3110540 RepID=UPI00237AD5E1|nr:A24 family peptidase [Paenibacillus humicola]